MTSTQLHVTVGPDGSGGTRWGSGNDATGGKRDRGGCVDSLGTGAALPALAQPVEVAPGVTVNRRVYPVPANEAPFFNFAAKSADQKAADDALVARVRGTGIDPRHAAQRALAQGWQAVIQGQDFATGARRFNQAYLLDPSESGIYQGFAAIAASRFKDFAFADELFRIAARMRNPSPALPADHARVMLMAGRPADAKPLLEKAIAADPGWAVPRANLAWTMLQLGDPKEACRLAGKVAGRDLEQTSADMTKLRQLAKC
ncbi:MAG TPA: tetratricopeptide repeat protein [Microvirga sp.]